MKNMKRIVIVVLVLHVNIAACSDEVCRNQPADLAFLIDASWSVGEKNFITTKDFVTQFVKFFEISETELKVSVFSFDDAIDTTNGFYFNQYSTKQSVVSAIGNMPYSGGGTNFEKPLRFAKNNIFQTTHGMRDFALNMLVFITDGQAVLDPQPGIELRKMGVIVFAVGVGSNTVTDTLRLIATNTSYIFPVTGYDLISNIEGSLRNKACEDIMANPCERDPKPCKNGAICSVRGGAKYSCLCMEGYTGHNCDIDIDDCEGIICYNGGTCVDGLNSYTCKCQDNFIGNHCEIDLMANPCERDPKPCKNGAVCSVREGTKYSCLCTEGYTGHNCDIDIDDCEGINCYNGGTCVDGLNSYTCKCQDNFIGNHCEIDKCKPIPTDVVFLMDSSRSSAGKFFNIQKERIKSLTEGWTFHPNHFQIAIVSFAKTAEVEAPLGQITNAVDLSSRLANISHRDGSSNLLLGLDKAIDILAIERPHISTTKKMLVILSDGLLSDPRFITNYLHKLSTISTFAVAIGEDVSHYYLRQLTSMGGGVFPYNNDDLRNTIISELIDDSCNVCKHSEETDIVIAVDLVDNDGNTLLTVVPTILNKLLDNINFGVDTTRLALITYDDAVSIRFTFDEYTQPNINKLRKDIGFFEHGESKIANLTLALQVAKYVLYSSQHGARDSARKIVMIVSIFQSDLNDDSRFILEEYKQMGVEIYTIGLQIDSKSFQVMSEIASTSFHIGLNGTIFADQIDTFIDIFSHQLGKITCKSLI